MRKTWSLYAAAVAAAIFLPGAAAATCMTEAQRNPGWRLHFNPIIPNLESVGRDVARRHRGVSNIRAVINHTDCPITIRKFDGSATSIAQLRSVPANGQVDIQFWIPWADDAGTYPRHHLIVAIDGIDKLWMYQDRGRIVQSTRPGYGGNAGFTHGGGDFDLHFTMIDGGPAWRLIQRP